MRAGLAIMAVIAAVGGLSLVVLPDEGKKNGKKGNGDGDDGRVAVVAPAGTAAVPPVAAAVADSAAGFSCRQDAAGIQLPNAVHESSGLALAEGGDFLWTHNDSGQQPTLYRVGMDGRPRGQVNVVGARVQDWEDVAAGPCPGGGRCLFVGDIGDNGANRPSITIYRFPEPATGDAQTLLPPDAFTASYPEGPQDAEALFVLPDGAVYVVTKGETGPVAIYQLPRDARPGTVARLTRVAQLNADDVKRAERITGAAASPDGTWLALRTLRTVSFYRTGNLSGGSLGAPLTFDLRPLQEPQGEAVEFGPDGTIHLSSEGGKRATPATLSRLRCMLPS
ncbi:MAG TPA: hypothetical protein VLK84_08035 [Longimicrobium sp.]|nr:hypothetical protein [Longimicrobium sp.]